MNQTRTKPPLIPPPIIPVIKVAPSIEYDCTPTMPCQHCVVGNARRIAENGNVELYLCPRCGGQSTLTHTWNWWFGISF